MVCSDYLNFEYNSITAVRFLSARQLNLLQSMTLIHTKIAIVHLMAIIEVNFNCYVGYNKLMMHKTHQNKVKKHPKKEIQTSATRLVKPKDWHHYQTSTATYIITINGETRPDQVHPQSQKIRPRSNKKIRFITEDIQKSQCIHNAKSLGSKKQLILKCSTLNDIEDLNVYSKAKSQKKDRKNRQKDKRVDKIRENPRNSASNGNLKIRGIKSHSKSNRQLQPKVIPLKSLEKSRNCHNKSKAHSQLNDYSTEVKDKSKKCQYESPQMEEVQNSYYFQSNNQRQTQEINQKLGIYGSDQEITKKEKQPQRKIKKKSMYLFESSLQEWKEPCFRIKGLESTRDLLN